MAVEIFQEIFSKAKKSESKIFSFSTLSGKLNFLTPNKISKSEVLYSMNDEDMINSLYDSIIRNLCTNPTIIQNPNFDLSNLSHFYQLTHENVFSETKLAQCFYLLHGSKADYTKLSPEVGIKELNFLLIQFSSINTTTSVHKIEIFNELSNIFLTVVKNDKITNTIWQTVEEIASIPNIFFDFSKIKLIFFDCEIKDLYGFSGKNRLYINTTPIKEFFNYNLNQSKKNILIKLNFLSLVLHEIGHILLRFKLNDLNISSPFLSQIKDNHGNVKKNVCETGQEVEKKFFKDCIDWFSSVHNINEEYCEEYLKLILNNQFVQFDAKQARVFTVKEDVLQKMSFSYRLRKRFYRF